jgi:hypothetical protein
MCAVLHNHLMSVPWAEVEPQLQDGGNTVFLCDVVVPTAAAGDWQRTLDLLRERQVEWELSYTEDGVPAELESPRVS